MRSNTPPNRDILLRTQPPESRRDHQERRLQLLLQEAEELNARLREQLTNPQCRQSQQTGDSIPATRRPDLGPTPKLRLLNATKSRQHNLEFRKRQREHPLSQIPPSEERIPHRTTDSDGLSEAGSSGTSPFGRPSDRRTREPTGQEVRAKFPQERQAYAKSLPQKEETDSRTTQFQTDQERPPRVHEALHPVFKHPRQAAPDEIARRLDDMPHRSGSILLPMSTG